MKRRDSLYLKIAGFTIAVHLKRAKEDHNGNKLLRRIAYFFNNFLETKPKKIDSAIDIKETSFSTFLVKKSSDYILFLKRFKNKKILTFSHISIAQFETIVLKVLERLLWKKGFVLHCSAVACGDEAFIFLEKSGGGKSTLVRLLSKDFLPIADDNLIIKKEENSYFAYQMPTMKEKMKGIKKGKEIYLVKRIFFLRKAKFIKIEKIKNTHFIVKKIFRQFFTEREYLIKQSKLLFDFITNLEFYYFYFNKNKKTAIYFRRFINNSLNHRTVEENNSYNLQPSTAHNRSPKDHPLNHDN